MLRCSLANKIPFRYFSDFCGNLLDHFVKNQKECCSCQLELKCILEEVEIVTNGKSYHDIVHWDEIRTFRWHHAKNQMVCIKLDRQKITKESISLKSVVFQCLLFLFHIDYSNSFREFYQQDRVVPVIYVLWVFSARILHIILFMRVRVFHVCVRFTQCYNQIQSIYHKPILSSKHMEHSFNCNTTGPHFLPVYNLHVKHV